MPSTFQRTFRVRHYECDAYGHLNNINYLRYMQETAFDAWADLGYSLARQADMGALWVVGETQLEYLQPLHYNDLVEVCTWMAFIGRSRARRMYEFRRTGEPALAASGYTDWIYVDSSSFQPRQVPEEMLAANYPDEEPPPVPPRQPFPEPPAPPPGAFSDQRRVTWSDVDTAGHVNNATYLDYMEMTGMEVALAYDWSVGRLLEIGAGWVARSNHIEYRQRAQLDEQLTITTYLSDVKRASCQRHYIIRKSEDQSLVARARTLWAFVDIEKGRPRRIPPQLMVDFADNIAGT